MIAVDVIIKVQFYDVDQMRVVWHGHYARFLEEARCALLDRIGYNYDSMEQSGYAWPIVDLRLKYVRPIRLFDVVRVTATLIEYEARLKIGYIIAHAADGEILTKAETTQFPVSLATGEVNLEIPARLIEGVRSLLP